VHRLGLSGTYRPGKKAIFRALDEGINVFFAYGIDLQMLDALRDALPSRREQIVVVTGAYNLIWTGTDVRKTLENRLRKLRTDYLDALLFLGVMKEEQFPQHVRDELVRLREEGKVHRIGLSTHDRKLAGKLAAEGIFDAFMVRYNAAHRGAETDVFPHLAAHDPAVISYTATRWRYMMRRPKGWDKTERVPTAGDAYRFVLSNPHVDVCLTAPSNLSQLEENLAAVRRGPPHEEVVHVAVTAAELCPIQAAARRARAVREQQRATPADLRTSAQARAASEGPRTWPSPLGRMRPSQTPPRPRPQSS
jgi:aryl-alcohol dehydrogenase-like predicted oxidoreductase